MLFEFGAFRIDVDVERTRTFYRDYAKRLVEGCDCVNCQNFDRAVVQTSDCVRSFFDMLGVDPSKSPEVYNVIGDLDTNGMVLYSGFYHLVGTVLDGNDIWEGNRGHYHLNPEKMYVVDETMRVGFTSKIDCLEEHFPMPCIQMEAWGHLPWVLD